jgi:phage antirepressor YoqD-like protein
MGKEIELFANAMSRAMTVGQVAKALSVHPDTVNSWVKKLFPGLPRNGIPTMLDEIQVTAIKEATERSGRNDLRNVPQLQNIHTDLEMARKTAEVMGWMQAKIQEMQNALALAAPKVEFFDQVADSKDAIPMRNVAAVLNIPGYGRNKLFARLRDLKILDSSNLPYREFQERGYFRVVEGQWSDSQGGVHITSKTLVYQKGLDFIRKTIG